MEINLTVVIVVAIVAAVVLAGFFLFRQRANVSAKSGNKEFSFGGSNDPAPGARIADAESSGGGALAEDETGRGATIERTKVQDDLIASNRNPRDDAPKA